MSLMVVHLTFTQVERTRDRPIACGDVSHKQALAFLAVQLSASLAILLSFDWYTYVSTVCVTDQNFKCYYYLLFLLLLL